ncbi:MAG: JAB domain-containing protein [Clostridia bacterium]|nr:JAB domain-containing protein [Clostridia bacterium]
MHDRKNAAFLTEFYDLLKSLYGEEYCKKYFSEAYLASREKESDYETVSNENRLRDDKVIRHGFAVIESETADRINRNAALIHRMLNGVMRGRPVTLNQCIDVCSEFPSFSDFAESGVRGFVKKNGLTKSQEAFIVLMYNITYKRMPDYSFNGIKLDNMYDIAEKLVILFEGEREETVHIFYVDETMNVLGHFKRMGNANAVGIDFKSVCVHRPYAKKCGIFVAHNHPNGVVTPSKSDFDFTLQLERAVNPCGIKLLDSFVVAENRVYSMTFDCTYYV